MTYEEFRRIKSTSGEENKKILKAFERENPGLVSIFEKRMKDEHEQIGAIIANEPDRMERWRKMAQVTHDSEWKRRRQREVM